jgi:hypothetical protein
LLKVVNTYESKTIFWSEKMLEKIETLSAEELACTGKDMAFIFQEGAAWAIQTNQYTGFSEMKKGFELGFDDGMSLREAMQLGAKDSKEYLSFLESGFSEITEYRKCLKTNNPKLYELWVENYNEFLPKNDLPAPKNINGFIELRVLESGGFIGKNCQIISDAFERGFWIFDDYKNADEKGFKTSEDYYLSQKFNIDAPEVMSIIHEYGIEDPNHWEKYCEIQNEIETHSVSDAFGLILQQDIKSILPGGRINLSKLKQMINQQVVVKCGMNDGIYSSFVKIMSDEECIIYLCSHSDLKGLIFPGYRNSIIRRYFSDEEKQTAVIDISNVVLHRNHGSDERIADVDLVVKLVSQLKKLNFQKLVGIADATIKRDVGDDGVRLLRNLLDQFQIVKPVEPADLYILEYAEKYPSVIVSNDQFTEWCREQHPWRVENVPRLSLTFEIEEDGRVYFGEKEMELTN